MNQTLSALSIGFLLMLVQVLLALPWLFVLVLSPDDRAAIRRNPFSTQVLQALGIAIGVCLAVPFFLRLFVQAAESLESLGHFYAALLQLQITVDLFILGFAGMLWLWPKGAAVAQATFREGVRQSPFWMLAGLAALFMFVSVFVPYFTFGEDYLMVKQLGPDTILLAAVLFGAVTASASISEEIEGRTAITVMSKPISRRQFMLGKFAGVLLAGLFMFGLLAVYFEGMLLLKHWWDKLEPFNKVAESQQVASTQTWIGVVAMPAWINTTAEWVSGNDGVQALVRGILHWGVHTADTLPGLVLCFSQVMVLVALAVALSTRVPMAVNMITILGVYFLAHLTPVLLAISTRAGKAPNTPVAQLVGFVARLLDTVLPDLGLFKVDPALLSDSPPDAMPYAQYVGSVSLYGVMYTTIVLLFGLILFEDRDLA